MQHDITGKLPHYFQRLRGQLFWREKAPNVSAEFADILDKAIEHDFRKRYSTATEMLNALKNYAEVVEMKKSLDSSQKSKSTRWLKIGIVAIIFLIVMAGAIAFYDKGNNTETDKQPNSIQKRRTYAKKCIYVVVRCSKAISN